MRCLVFFFSERCVFICSIVLSQHVHIYPRPVPIIGMSHVKRWYVCYKATKWSHITNACSNLIFLYRIQIFLPICKCFRYKTLLGLLSFVVTHCAFSDKKTLQSFVEERLHWFFIVEFAYRAKWSNLNSRGGFSFSYLDSQVFRYCYILSLLWNSLTWILCNSNNTGTVRRLYKKFTIKKKTKSCKTNTIQYTPFFTFILEYITIKDPKLLWRYNAT